MDSFFPAKWSFNITIAELLTVATQRWENYNERKHKEIAKGQIVTATDAGIAKALVSLNLSKNVKEEDIGTISDKIAEKIEAALIGLAGVIQQNSQMQQPQNTFQHPFQQSAPGGMPVPAPVFQKQKPRAFSAPNIFQFQNSNTEHEFL